MENNLEIKDMTKEIRELINQLSAQWSKINLDQPIPSRGGIMMNLDYLIKELEKEEQVYDKKIPKLP
jgi:hypothetical protein